MNHTLANLDQQTDPNPFEPDENDPNPTIPNAVLRVKGFERSEVIEDLHTPHKGEKDAAAH